ncbi:MAG: hypothetical protein JWQ57_1001 [Mucilaginibacter sp.]|nr:hypothetical protein [Mucilaginibacter sp.]
MISVRYKRLFLLAGYYNCRCSVPAEKTDRLLILPLQGGRGANTSYKHYKEYSNPAASSPAFHLFVQSGV